MFAILETIKDRMAQGEDLVLAVVRETEGSVPRGKGAAMLIGSSGILKGSIGGGHIAKALTPILASVDFRVVVMYERPEFAANGRFPRASQVVCGDFGRLDGVFTFRENDYAVVVTSGHVHDFEVEEQLLRKELAYVGVIGSRKKTAAVNEKLRAAGITEDQLAKVHTPIGLAIGAVTPEEIAVSIAAEMIAVRAERRKNGR